MKSLSLLLFTGHALVAVPTVKFMLLTAHSNQYHDWTRSLPLVKSYLEQTGLFTVDKVVTPPTGADMSSFTPHFFDDAAIVTVERGSVWATTSKVTQEVFADFPSKKKPLSSTPTPPIGEIYINFSKPYFLQSQRASRRFSEKI